MLSNIQHWQSFYQASQTPTFPSQFAVFVQSWLVDCKETIIEIGCGNGRDSMFLNQAGHSVVVTDQVICESLRAYADQKENFKFKEGDIVDAVTDLHESVDMSKRVVVYSRFFQHAIDEKTEKRMLKALVENISKDSELFFEFRLDGDQDQPKVFGTEHYRRFQSAQAFMEVLDDSGLTCTYYEEGKGYARYGAEDPLVGRFVAKPKPIPALRIV